MIESVTEAIHFNYRGNYVSTTKYTATNFIPKSLFEQFRRVANIYFLVVAFVSFSPLAPYTALSVLAPLIVVIGATMVKEAVEDWRRRKQDVEANNRKVQVYSKDNSFHETRWKNLQVGDLVRVHKDEYFPADLILISSSYDDGICYVETMNLDGETNLKLKQSLEVTSSISEERSLEGFKAIIRCEDPNDNLYSFVGNLHYGGKEYSLSPKQILLRDSKLKNTDYIHGVVVFTGHDTKVTQNSTDPPSKRSKIEQRMDKIIYILFSTLITISFIGSFFFGIDTKRDLTDGKYRRWYLRPDDTTVFYDPQRASLAGFFHFLTGLMLYGYLIPISLYVSIEIVKVLQSIFINQDRDMYHEKTDRPARARTSNLNEELGQIDTILSDKTGTLTCNSMEFIKCSIVGVAYGRGETEVEREIAERKDPAAESSEISTDSTSHDQDVDTHPFSQKHVKGFNFYDERIMNGRWVNEPNHDAIQKFFQVLAICHTVIPDVNEHSGEIHYEAESPDEAAFVIAARELGFEFFERKQTTISLHEIDFETGAKVDRNYELLYILEFSSSCKRMSVVVRNEEGRLLLLSKGADSIMFERLSKDSRTFLTDTRDHINQYSEAGLRTLVIAYQELGEDEYRTWEDDFSKALASVSAERDALIEATADKIERDFNLLGATAVEDKLQEGVPECIQKLAVAGIKIWVLTGDKLETAVNIGYACKLLRQGMRLFTITLDSAEIEDLEKRGDKDALIKASQESVQQQFQEAKCLLAKDNTGLFGLIIDGKSLNFALKKDLEDQFLDIAVKCASVICCRSSPKQKALAVMVSDFAIAQFRFLERLLLVHGHWCYRRIAMMVCYFFYKNITFGFTLFWFEAYASFSGQPAYNDWYMSFYNVFFTSLPVIALGVFDQYVSARLCLKYPLLYQEGTQNVLFNWPWILGWMCNGVGSSVIIFFCTSNAIIGQAFRSEGQVADYEILGITMYTCVVWGVNCQMAVSVNYFTWIQHVFIWGSIALWYLFLEGYGYITPNLSTTAYMVFVEACAPSLVYWLSTLLVVVSTLLPYFSYRPFQSRFHPMPHDIMQRRRLIEVAENENRAGEGEGELPVRVKEKIKHLKEKLRREKKC